ncbi:MAG: hypothetical protein ACI9J5_003724, partial [Paraglaciecola sp.]
MTKKNCSNAWQRCQVAWQCSKWVAEMVFNEQEGDAGLCFYCSTLGKSHSPSRKSVMVQLAPHWQLNLNPCNEGGLATFLASIVL